MEKTSNKEWSKNKQKRMVLTLVLVMLRYLIGMLWLQAYTTSKQTSKSMLHYIKNSTLKKATSAKISRNKFEHDERG